MRLLALTLSLLSLCACTSVQIINPNPHVESPETRGERGLKIVAQEDGGHFYTITDDGEKRPPDISEPSTYGAMDLNAQVLYAPAAPIELGLEFHPLGYAAGIALLVKYQLQGAGTRAAQAGDWPIGVYLRTGYAYSNASGDQETPFGDGGYSWKSQMDTVYIHAGGSFGYRISNHVMVYWGAAVGQYWVNAEIDQDTAQNGASPGGVYKNNDSGLAETVGPGVMFNWKYVQFYAAGEATHIQYHNTVAENDVFATVGVSITPRDHSGGGSGESSSGKN